MNARFATYLVVLGGLTLAAGCFVDLGEFSASGSAGTGELYSCRDNADCQRGEYCLRGFCRDVPPSAQQCRTSRDCGYRETCINGFCTEICARDQDCSSGGCMDNYCCMPPPRDGGTFRDGGMPSDGGTPPSNGGTAACARHSDCGAGMFCINAACYHGCQIDADCSSAELCQLGVCRPRNCPANPTCSTGAQCGTGQDCVDGHCRSKCSASSPCASGQSCVIGYCTLTPSAGSGRPCASSCDCVAGESCLNSTCGF